MGRYLCKFLSVEGDAALRCLDQAGNGVHGRGFPGAVGTDQSYDLSVAHLKGDALDRLDHAVPDFQIFNFQHIYTSCHLPAAQGCKWIIVIIAIGRK